MTDLYDRCEPNNMNVRNYSSKRVPGGTHFDSLPWQMGNDLTPIASECGATIGFTNPQFPTLGGSDANRGTQRSDKIQGGTQMLRRGLAALMMGVICAGSVTAEHAARNQQSVPRAGLMGWLKPKVSGPVRGSARLDAVEEQSGGIQRAVIDDAERQAAQPQVSLTANQVADDVVVVAPSELALQPSPIEQVPTLPNLNTLSGPQYFSAVPGSGPTNPVPVYPSNNWQTYSAPIPVQQASSGYYSPISAPGMAGPVSMTGQAANGSVPGSAAYGSGQYPQTGAALYPAPVPGIPQQIGGTLIPNQAFHPHEMLYAHRYRAMYPPYYYKVNGGWMVTPFGVWSREDWKLQGTMVDVKYKSSISPFALYKRPVIR